MRPSVISRTPIRASFRACLDALLDLWAERGPAAYAEEAALLQAHGYSAASLLLEAEARLGGKEVHLCALRVLAEDHANLALQQAA